MPFNLSPMEMLFVMVVLLLLFGSKRLPELGAGLGKGIREFKRTIRDVSGDVTAGEAAPHQFHAPVQPWQVPAQSSAAPAPAPAVTPVAEPVERKDIAS
jgi:sec-independent protein translocase protein TatA